MIACIGFDKDADTDTDAENCFTLQTKKSCLILHTDTLIPLIFRIFAAPGKMTMQRGKNACPHGGPKK